MAEDRIGIERGEPGVAVVVLRGEHEAYTGSKLERQLAALLAEGVALVIDLSRTTFVDSTTLLVLLKARAESEQRGLGFALQMDDATGQYVRRIFEITRLTSVFSVFRTRAEAVEGARSRRPGPQTAADTA